MDSLCQWLLVVLVLSQWGHTVVVLGRIMSIENIQNASERDDTRPGQAGERSYDPYLTDNTGLLEA